jgi:eukaryotic-like serine/threonine-protein kinase
VGAALETPNVPQVVGRYVLYGAIASGGMATVHFGRLVGAAGFARPVAIKRLHAPYARDPEFVKMFLDEARLAARIVHPNVVQTIDLVEATNEVFLVMEYVRGMALSSLVRLLRQQGERVPVRISLGILVGVLEGLHAAHDARDDMGERLDLVHRDVSPQNVLVGTDGIARLIDFGVAKAAGRSQSTRDGQVKGKIAYMAPEQVQGLAVTRRTDIYAASVLLWELLTGRRLFFGESDADSIRRVLNDEVGPPSSVLADLPPTIDCVVMKGLERDASKRYATAHDMALELGACMPAAAPAEIGEWIERVAAAELSERASRIAAIERSAAESMSRLTVASVPGEGAPDRPTPIGGRALDAATNVHRIAGTAANDAGEAADVSSFGHEVRARRRTLFLAVASTLAILGVGLVVALATLRGGTPSQPSSGLAASAILASAAPTTSAVLPPESETVAPSAGAAPSSEPVTVKASVAPTFNATTAAAAPRAARVAPAAPSAGPKPGCDPPYTEDAQGHLHFKPSCM